LGLDLVLFILKKKNLLKPGGVMLFELDYNHYKETSLLKALEGFEFEFL
jgi:hypothetical protein